LLPAIVLLIQTNTRLGIFHRVLTAKSKLISCVVDTLVQSTTVTVVGRGHSVRVVAITKLLFDTATLAILICTIAIGSEIGQTSAWKSMAQLQLRILVFYNSLPKGKQQNETHASSE
jgi:hypothetical protein